MSQTNWNVLTQPFLEVSPVGWVSLPGLLACLTRDEIDSFPALRPHQAPAWHMFLVQLAALALHRAGTSQLPQAGPEWAQALRGLTPDFPGDEPWCLVVDDRNLPAFLQPPVPAGLTLKTEVSTPDSLDLLITSRNHDLKQEVARQAEAQDWVFALVSLQTCANFGGNKNYWVARVNGAYSSRTMFGLAPMSQENYRITMPRLGSWFRRDVAVLLATREEEWNAQKFRGYPANRGLALTWVAPWEEGEQLTLDHLDLWFIEVCRRVRLRMYEGRLLGQSGNSIKMRIMAKDLHGDVGDPWAPVYVSEVKSFSLAERRFDYRVLIDILFSGDFKMPLLAQISKIESHQATMLLVAEAISSGKNTTSGFKSRILPIGGRISRALTLGPKRKELHELAKAQVEEIEKFDEALRDALALAASGGQRDKIRRHYSKTNSASACLDRAADEIFFDHLWRRYEAQEEGGEALKREAERFTGNLNAHATAIFNASLPGIPCPSLYRPRAEARARSKFRSMIRFAFPELFASRTTEGDNDALA